MNKKFLLFFLLLTPALFSTCRQSEHRSQNVETSFEVIPDLPEILKSGEIRVVTTYNSTDYFVYKGLPMGFQFELLQNFADFTGVKLSVSVNNNLEENIQALQNGEIDIIASSLAVTREDEVRVAFSEPHSYSRQVLIQQAYKGKMNGSPKNRVFNEIIRNQLELGGKSIYVQKKSAFALRLRNLSNEIGDSINVVEVPDYDVEQLIALVSEGEIPYTVCDENLAKVNKNFYPNIDIETAISFPQKQAWAVNKNAPELLNAVNNWLIGYKRSARYNRTFDKYFLNQRSGHIVNSGFHSVKGGLVSTYDDFIRKESAKTNWDWRLIASIIYQESRFIPDAQSWTGAQGLMQLMPETAKRFGVESVESPRENISGGIKLLQWLDKRLALRVSDANERLKFVLASYNVGIGHVIDAMALAEKNGKDPQVWDENVDYYILNKSKPSYYNDPVVKFGYCRGEEPYNYVKEILERYDHYKNVIR
ncbi:MAG: transporter substrate-binding domain-containing protein [Cytophagaceae bacterium]|jgi:membrane-bound lytic murein transglycosylase F|nr:transporter substrate-binding domain-containing protein [Cytophagaceae bacterium]